MISIFPVETGEGDGNIYKVLESGQWPTVIAYTAILIKCSNL